MHKELELWQFIVTRLKGGLNVMLLVVAESSGSSPGRQGYKMAVAEDGELFGSIGGGVMEVTLVDQSRGFLRDAVTRGRGYVETLVREQVHRKGADHASGMICSGKQTVIFRLLTPEDKATVGSIIDGIELRRPDLLTISRTKFTISMSTPSPETDFSTTDTGFTYVERLGFQNDLYIIGGGHCALALSELTSKMDFHITLFDDRPDLNTIVKNRFAHDIRVIQDYERIGDHVPPGENVYVVVMTLGYKSDAEVIRALIDKDFKYFGVLGSNAKMSSMFKEFTREGHPAEKLDRIRTPVGIAINSRTPEEIAVSIAAEIISVKNG